VCVRAFFIHVRFSHTSVRNNFI